MLRVTIEYGSGSLVLHTIQQHSPNPRHRCSITQFLTRRYNKLLCAVTTVIFDTNLLNAYKERPRDGPVDVLATTSEKGQVPNPTKHIKRYVLRMISELITHALSA